MSTFITTFATSGAGPRLAVKDLIDMEGVPTTAGCKAVADHAEPAAADAPCLAGARAAGARIVGKANLHELAFGTTGLNQWFGNPVNPLDPRRIPGGSSSGSAVAVANGDADIAFGSDTGGSVRIPSACCGTAGLKTTWGRVSLEGVWPLSTSLDTIGPMARDVAGLVAGMQLLEPGFSVATSPARVVGRFRVEADPVIDAAVDAALAAAELEVVDIQLPGWQAAFGAGAALLIAEAYVADRHLDRSGISDEVAARLEMGASVDSAQVASAREAQVAWRAELARAFQRVEVVALPTLATTIPLLDDEEDLRPVAPALPVNFAGVPAIALPVPAGPLPASLQLIGPHHAEDLLLATGRIVEAAVS